MQPTTHEPGPGVTTRSERGRIARFTGIAYLALFALSIVGIYEPASLADITGSETRFRISIVVFLAIAVLDVLIAWGLMVFLSHVDRNLSVLTAWFRVGYSFVLGAVITFHVVALGLATGVTEIDASHLESEVSTALSGFDFGWLIALALFGVHLALLGYLIVRSGFMPRVMGYVLLASGAIYLLDTVFHVLIPTYSDYETLATVIVAIPSVVGEFWLAVWLLRKGSRQA